MKTSFFVSIIATIEAKHALPTAVFHGMGDQCVNPGMHDFAREIGLQTGAYSHCVEVGNGSETSLFHNFADQAKMACDAVIANENFQGDFNVVGLSQGSLLARWIVEKCPTKGKVHKYLSVGGPNMGVESIPGCSVDNTLCNYINYAASNLVYFKLSQNYIGPAGYFRDTRHMERYISDSVFLPDLNNERGDDATKLDAKNKFESLDAVMLVMFTEDTVVHPKESEWFQQLGEDNTTVQPLEESDFYIQDYIGIRALKEAGKVEFISIVGDHLQFSDSDIQNTFIPFLLA